MKNLLTLIPILFFFSCDNSTEPQAVHGCLDSQACNYNPEANLDNNSCDYDDFSEGACLNDECLDCLHESSQDSISIPFYTGDVGRGLYHMEVYSECNKYTEVIFSDSLNAGFHIFHWIRDNEIIEEGYYQIKIEATLANDSSFYQLQNIHYCP